MAAFPGALPSATPANHGEVVDELRAVAQGVLDSVAETVDLPSITTEDPDRMVTEVAGVRKGWLNEWGALRGTSPFVWGDALVRAIRSATADGITSGNFAELEDRRAGLEGKKIWARRWLDGALVRNDIVMADTYVMAAGGTPPAGLPDGTVVIELDA